MAFTDIKSLIGQAVRAHIGIHEYNGRQYNHIDWYLPPIPKELAYLLLGEFVAWETDHPCPADDGRHRWIFDAACAGRRCSLPPELTENLIHRLLTRAPRHGEVEHAVSNAYGYQYSGSGRETPRNEIGEYDPDLLSEIAMEGPEVTPEQLARVSPVSVDVTPAEFLHIIHGGMIGFVSINMHLKGGFPLREYPSQAIELKRFADSHQPYVVDGKAYCGAWFLCNPVDGEWRDGSIRSERNLTAYDYAVLESDKAPADLWLSMLVQQPLPIAAIYTSGNKSIHCLVRVGARSLADLKEKLHELKVKYVPLGADDSALTAIRLTRLPGITRKDNRNTQRLLYLNARPTCEPICKKNILVSTKNETGSGKGA